VVGTVASSMTRRGMEFGRQWHVRICSGGFCCCKLWQVSSRPVPLWNHSLGQRACDCECRGVGWIKAGQVGVRPGVAMFVVACCRNHLHGRRVGTEADQRGRGGMCFGKTWSVRLLRGNAGCV
jgi:hypothetical protein